jgi:hypothetical protein
MKCSRRGFAYDRQKALRPGVRQSQILAVGSSGADTPNLATSVRRSCRAPAFRRRDAGERHKPSGLINLHPNDPSLTALYVH